MRTLNAGPGHPWRRDGLLPRGLPIKTMGGGAVQSDLLRLGWSPLCGPDGLALGFDHVQLGRLGRLTLGRRNRAPHRWAFSNARPQFRPRAPLATRYPSEKAPPQDRPQVAALFGAACSASLDRPCAGQLALHMASTVRLRSLSRLALGLGLGIVPHTAGVLRTGVRTQDSDRAGGIAFRASYPPRNRSCRSKATRTSSSTRRPLRFTPARQTSRGPPTLLDAATLAHPAHGKRSGGLPTARTSSSTLQRLDSPRVQQTTRDPPALPCLHAHLH
jgi:hypothetical protein